ncbi:SEC59/DGK1/VTE5 family protein [Candidatus Trichorickettsia mobilis]|uniref:SEC59/DGK1/VTE5 family protein n=1 Tax=Candidatus Trichorickettsia mobilis TaxID=1346319 RepID=UPI002930B8C7|nr:SEC59/DGK1/VTE5 family protein [Candidatus Trichorickettsia mobilis]
MTTANFHFESQRKIFHSYSIIFPLIYLFMPKIYMVIFLFIFLVPTIYIDFNRHHRLDIRNFVDRFFGKFIRASEAHGTFKLSGASFMIAGFFITALLFVKPLAITSWLILIISDSLAALVGIKIGTVNETGKSKEGSIAFLSSAILISIVCYVFIGYDTNFFIIIISCICATLSEYYAKKININDNLLIPLVYSLSTSILLLII